MTTETNLNVVPYFDDFDPDKNYHRILFRPSFPVQARELTQMQTILQDQIEKFGQNIYKTGTIISGCSLHLDSKYDYVTIFDLDSEEYVVNVESFANCIIRNTQTGLVGRVVDVIDGFESSPTGDKKTLYIKYLENGSQSNASTFGVGNTLMVQVATQPVNDYRIITRGAGYANGLIVKVNVGLTPSVVATGRIVTDSSGQVEDIAVLVAGEGYDSESLSNTNLSIYQSDGTTPYTHGSTHFNITPINYVSKPVVDTAGVGYAARVSPGVIFQKGFFIRVEEQSIVVSKYNTISTGYPNNVVLGFSTTESIANSATDPSLLDNAAGYTNYQAPGAHRLKLVPTLATMNTDTLAAVSVGGETAVENFFAIAEFQRGRMVRDRTTTQFNSVNTELARRTFEESGNYVVEQIQVDTEDGDLGYDTIDGVQVANPLKDKINVVVGKGVSYVYGYRNELTNPLRVPIGQATNVVTPVTPLSVTTGYESYFQVNRANLFGSLDVGTGTTVYLSSNVANLAIGDIPGTITNVIGTAKLRNVTFVGSTGNIDTDLYNVYVYDVVMYPGYSPYNIRAAGVDDIFIAQSTSDANILELNGGRNESLVFSLNAGAIAGITSPLFTYREYFAGQALSASAATTLTISSPDSFLKTGADITLDNKADIIVVANNDIFNSTNLTGTLSSSGNTITGAASQFLTELAGWENGLWINRGGTIGRITGVTSDTAATWTAGTIGSGTAAAGFANNSVISPKFFKASTSSGQQMTIEILTGQGNWSGVAAACSIDVYASVISGGSISTQATTKIANATFVKLSNTVIVPSTNGPWPLGITDGYYIEGVWVGTGSSYANSASSPNVKDNFELVTGQKDSHYGISYLRVKPGSAISLGVNNENLLVKVAFWSRTSTSRFASVDSYPLANVEYIPFFTSKNGIVYNLRNCVDFRPYANNVLEDASKITLNEATAAIIDNANLATNSVESVVYPGGGLRVPMPTGIFTANVGIYTPRIDKIVIDKNGNISSVTGSPDINPKAPPTKPGTMAIATVYVPPYPSLSFKQAYDLRRMDQAVRLKVKQQRGYTMEDIGNIEERVSRVEYYSALSLLESNTQNLIIPSETDATIERFKNGFFVDPMNDYSIANTDYKNFEIDTENSIATPRFDRLPLNLKLSSNSGVDIHNDRVGGMRTATLANNGVEVMSYFNKPTRVRNLVEGFTKWVGAVHCFPPIDTSVISTNNTITTNVASRDTNVISETSNTVFMGVTPYIRPQRIYMYITGLVPGRKHYVFFDGVNVTSECMLAHFPQTWSATSHAYAYSSPGVDLTSYPDNGRLGIALNIGNFLTGESDTRFLTGEKEIVVMDVNDYDSQDSAYSIARGSFSAYNTATNNTTNIVRGDGSIPPPTPPAQPDQNSAIVTFIGSDPVAQTFKVPSITEAGRFIHSIKVLFARKPDPNSNQLYSKDAGVTMEIRRTVNGYPAGPLDVIGRSYLAASAINVLSEDATTMDVSKYTTFTFSKPVYVESGEEYAMVLYPDGNVPDYLIWVGKTGENVMGTTTTYNTQDIATTGTLFQSTSGTAWIPVKDEDVVYEIRSSLYGVTSGTLVLKPNDYEFMKFSTQLDATFNFKPTQKVAQLTSNAYGNGTVSFAAMSGNGFNMSTAVSSNPFSATDPVSSIYYEIRGVDTNYNSVFGAGDGVLLLKVANSHCINLTFYETGGANNHVSNVIANSVGNFLIGNTTGGSLSNFDTFIKVGDFVAVPDSIDGVALQGATNTSIRQVVSCNATHIQVDFKPLKTWVNSAVPLSLTSANTVVKKVTAIKSHVSTVNTAAIATTMFITDFIPYDFVNSVDAEGQVAYEWLKVPVGTITDFDTVENKIWLQGSSANSATAYKFVEKSASYLGTIINTSYSNSVVFTTNRASISDVQDLNVDYVETNINVFEPVGTSVAGTFTCNFPSTVTKSFRLNEKTSVDYSSVIKSKSNDANSFVISLSLSAVSSAGANTITPKVMFDPSTSFLYSAIINNDTTGENTVFGSALAKYVSVTATLNEDIDAEDIFVYTTAHRPSGSDVKVYAKIMSTDDVGFDSKTWTELRCDYNKDVYASLTNRNDFREYRFTFNNMPPIVDNQVGTASRSSYTLTGAGTLWNTGATALVANDAVLVVDNVTGEYDTAIVNSVSSDTSLTLKTIIEGTLINNLSVRKFVDKQVAYKNGNTGIVEYYDAAGSKHVGFQQYAIKAVMTRSDASVIPTINDIRAIATSV